MKPYYLEAPPIQLPVHHHLLWTRELLRTSPTIANALVVAVSVLAATEPCGDLLRCVLYDLDYCLDDLEYLNSLETSSPLEAQALATRAALEEVRASLAARVGETPAERPNPQSPVKAWITCWADFQVTRSMHTLGEAAILYHQEVDRDKSYLGDQMDATAAGLICDLPLLAGHLEAVDKDGPEADGVLLDLARVLRTEAQSLLEIFKPRWKKLWQQIASGQLQVDLLSPEEKARRRELAEELKRLTAPDYLSRTRESEKGTS